MATLQCSYHERAFRHDSRIKRVSKITKLLRKYPKRVGLAFTGLSGMVVGMSVVNKTSRDFAIVRKPGENNHGYWTVEGYNVKEYFIIDDFICSGATIKRIIKQMGDAKCLGIILYDYDGGTYDTKTPFEYKGKKYPIFTIK